MYGMSGLLHIPARANAPIACDMSTAADSPEQRLADYGRLFADALIRRARHAGAVVFVFRSDPQISKTIEDLVRREAACCPFLDYGIETTGAEIVWTITNPATGEDRAGVEVILAAFHALPDWAGS
jgi:hypothetical protein